MNAEVYYFTGTGNSLAVAKELSEKLRAENIDAVLVPVPSAIRKTAVKPEAEIVGIVFPVYYIDLPNMVKAFAAKLEGLEDKYIFAVATYGGGKGCSVDSLAERIGRRGGTLSAGYGIHMPQNAFYKFWERKKKIFRKAGRQIVRIAREVAARKTNIRPEQPGRTGLKGRLHTVFIEASKKFLAGLSDAAAGASIEESIYSADMSLAAGENCNGCGTCEKVCPAGNIRIVDGKPEWLHRCENCRACLNWCPRQAVSGKVFSNRYFYRHPAVTAGDMSAQRGAAG
jgi:ferredoxin/flavodoxin